MDNEQKNKFELELESLEQNVEYQKLKRQSEEEEEEANIEPEGSNVVPARKWRAPEDWRPPGWNEEKSYQTAMKFMGFNANPK